MYYLIIKNMKATKENIENSLFVLLFILFIFLFCNILYAIFVYFEILAIVLIDEKAKVWNNWNIFSPFEHFYIIL